LRVIEMSSTHTPSNLSRMDLLICFSVPYFSLKAMGSA
jgi:hypothetical protein